MPSLCKTGGRFLANCVFVDSQWLGLGMSNTSGPVLPENSLQDSAILSRYEPRGKWRSDARSEHHPTETTTFQLLKCPESGRINKSDALSTALSLE